jgi:hypothetical protein
MLVDRELIAVAMMPRMTMTQMISMRVKPAPGAEDAPKYCGVL